MQRIREEPPDTSAINEPIDDPLGEALHLLKLSGTFYCQSTLSAPWGIEIPALDDVMTFLTVSSGACWLDIEGTPPLFLEKGNLALITCGRKHSLRSAADVQTEQLSSLIVQKVSERYETLHYGGGGDVTQALYGIVRFDHAAGQQLMTLLPDVLKIDTWEAGVDAWLQSTLQLIAHEARELRPGGETIITRLADILIIQAIRCWLDNTPKAESGWLSALRDRQIGQAIIAIHRAPANDWTVEALARTVGMARSTFSERFTRLVEQSPMQYITRWRMQLAHAMLAETSDPLSRIAINLGYQSEAAFCRAFKRVFKVPPGSIRQKSRIKTPIDKR